MTGPTAYDKLTAIRVWPSPFLPPIWPSPPELAPWASPGRVSLAPELSLDDQIAWVEACDYARPTWPLTLRGLLWQHLVDRQRELWPLPDDPLDPPEWLRRVRVRPFIDYAGRVNDPALRLGTPLHDR